MLFAGIYSLIICTYNILCFSKWSSWSQLLVWLFDTKTWWFFFLWIWDNAFLWPMTRMKNNFTWEVLNKIKIKYPPLLTQNPQQYYLTHFLTLKLFSYSSLPVLVKVWCLHDWHIPYKSGLWHCCTRITVMVSTVNNHVRSSAKEVTAGNIKFLKRQEILVQELFPFLYNQSHCSVFYFNLVSVCDFFSRPPSRVNRVMLIYETLTSFMTMWKNLLDVVQKVE